MAQPTDEKLHQDLIKSGYTQSVTDPNKYTKPGDNGNPQNMWTDGSYRQKQEDSASSWIKHE